MLDNKKFEKAVLISKEMHKKLKTDASIKEQTIAKCLDDILQKYFKNCSK